MNTFLNAELRYQDVEGGIKNIDDLCLTDHRSITVCEVRNQDAQEEMSRLFLCKNSGVAFAVQKLSKNVKGTTEASLHVALLCHLCDRIAVHGELGVS